MADEKLTALTANTAPIATDILYMVDDPGGSPASRKATLLDVVAGSLLGSQLVNEIKGWPPIVQPDADLVTLNLWWDDVATPTTKATVVDLAGEAGITETWELALKCVGDGAGDGLQQTWTYADEPRLKSGRVMSALVAIWSVGGISITAKLVNSDASETAASAVTAAAWTIVEIPNHTLTGTTVSLQITAGAAGTFYVVPLGANIGARGFALRPRGLRYADVHVSSTSVVNAVDPGANWTDVDCTAVTSPNCVMVHLVGSYSNSSAAGKSLRVRRNGSSDTAAVQVLFNATTTVTYGGRAIVPVDDANIFEYVGSDVAGDTESCTISIAGWWEWE